MASFNKVILMGNLTQDPQVRYVASGTAVCDLRLAVNRTWYDKQSQQRREDVTFVDVTLWARQAEIAGEYLSKGRSVLIEGRLQLDTWQDKETGQNRSKLRVVCENMTMVGGRSDGGGNRGGGGPSGGGRQSGGENQGGGENYGGGYDSGNDYEGPAGSYQDNAPTGVPDDEVPF